MNSELWTPLEHHVYRELNSLSLAGKKLLLMVSGGADSLALLQVMRELRSALQVEISVLHCHHGDAPGEQGSFRNQAAQFVAKWCEQAKVPFFQQKASQSLKSEEEMRDFRKACAQSFVEKENVDFVLWGHHSDDLLETQFLRLIRGAGPQAIAEPMRLQKQKDLRPLLTLTRQEIQQYLKDRNQQWVDDPSNQNENHLRNWLRHNWLPQLETKCPGALRAFSRSLDLIQESVQETLPSEIWLEEGISRPLFLTLCEAQKKQVLALYLHRCGQKEFTHNQLKEILKHLDISQTNHTFKAVHLNWCLSKELISAKSAFVVNAF